jgi:hypothetical protein
VQVPVVGLDDGQLVHVELLFPIATEGTQNTEPKLAL